MTTLPIKKSHEDDDNDNKSRQAIRRSNLSYPSSSRPSRGIPTSSSASSNKHMMSSWKSSSSSTFMPRKRARHEELERMNFSPARLPRRYALDYDDLLKSAMTVALLEDDDYDDSELDHDDDQCPANVCVGQKRSRSYSLDDEAEVHVPREALVDSLLAESLLRALNLATSESSETSSGFDSCSPESNRIRAKTCSFDGQCE